MAKVGVVAVLALLLGGDVPVLAGPTLEHMLAMGGTDAILHDTEFDVVVAVVEAREGGGDTNGDPPRLRLRVLEVLRGGRDVDRRHGVWEPFPHDVDWLGPDTDALITAWEREPLRGPAIGSKFVLAGEVSDRGDGLRFWISPLGRFPWSDSVATWARTELGRTARLRAEALEFKEAWPRQFSKAELLDGARPVTAGTVLEPGQPVLMQWGVLWQGRVVTVHPDGRVRVRPERHDSRWDADVGRGTLLLYPEGILATERRKEEGSGR